VRREATQLAVAATNPRQDAAIYFVLIGRSDDELGCFVGALAAARFRISDEMMSVEMRSDKMR